MCRKKTESMDVNLKSVNDYRFQSDEEPTDKQLRLLMKEVAADVKLRAEIANKKFQEDLRLLCVQAAKQPLLK